MNGAGLDLATVTIVIAIGAGLTFLALCIVFGGFFAERRLRDRLEDIETRTLTGARSLQMATLRRVERQGRLPTLDRLLWRWFPNASSIRQKLQASGTNMTLGDYAFIAISVAVAVAFVLYLVLDMAPGVALAGSLLLGIGLPNIWVGWRVQQEVQLGTPIEAALWRAAKTVQTDEFNFLIVAMSIQRDTGGNLAETLANLSALLRARQQLRLKIRAFTSEARTTMLIMAGLPFLVGGGLFLISP